ncbi:MAG: response regulator, partial [Prevotellaceae bacterium]|nr:response regulator [Prevotellaceae bacterium]
GTGIGLALAKSLATLHEGTLTVESAPGKGATFIFCLGMDNLYPQAARKENQSPIPSVPLPPADDEEEEGVGADRLPLLLIVEDNADIRDYIAESFHNNYRILTTTNGKEGWALAQEQIPDIIVSDIMMPEMDGIELCRHIKEDVRTSHIPVVLLTAKDSLQDKEEGYESGADSYLTKPFTSKLLRSRVRNLLEARRRLAEQITARIKAPDTAPSQPAIHLNRLDEEFLVRFQRIVEENIDNEALDIPLLADQLNISQSSLYRKIKGLTGISSKEYIRKIRLKNSLRLLTEEGFNVTEAAYASGFNDLNYFRECFKSEYGMTPKRYVSKK